MGRRYATGIFAVLAFALLTAGADDFWVKKEWKQWTPAECKKLLEDSPWTKRILIENETNANRLPSAANGANVDTALNKDAGEVNYLVQIRSAEPIREALIRERQIDQHYDTMTDSDKKAFDSQTDQLYKDQEDAIIVHVKYYGNRDSLNADLEKSWKSLPADTVPADVILISSNGTKATPTSYVADPNGENGFQVSFPRSGFADGLKSFKLQIPHPALGDFGGQKKMVEFRLDKMTFQGKPAF